MRILRKKTLQNASVPGPRLPLVLSAMHITDLKGDYKERSSFGLTLSSLLVNSKEML